MKETLKESHECRISLYAHPYRVVRPAGGLIGQFSSLRCALRTLRDSKDDGAWAEWSVAPAGRLSYFEALDELAAIEREDQDATGTM